MYCKLKGASIGCCHRQCRKSFHLKCGIEKNCMSEFLSFRSFCHIHHGIKRVRNPHEENDICMICLRNMGRYVPVTSVKTICCNQWKHQICLKKQAFILKDDFKCPSCGNIDEFRNNLLLNGVYIPDG